MASDDEESPSINISGLGKLPKFDGKGNVKRFLKGIEKRGKLENWTDSNKLTIVQYLCIDLAEAYVDSIPDLDNLTYKEFTDALKSRFEPKLSKPEAYSELMAIEQGRDNVNDYAGRIESAAADLADIIIELRDPDERDALLISVFRSGLDTGIQKALAANDYDEFTDIVKAARRCESVLYKGRRNINQISSEAPRRDQTNCTDDRNAPTTSQAQNYYDNNQGPPQNNRPDMRHIQCWNCGKRGHVSRWCRSPPNNQQNRYDNNRYDDQNRYGQSSDVRQYNNPKNY